MAPPGLYAGSIHGSITLDPSVPSGVGPDAGEYLGAVLAFDVQINDTRFAYTGPLGSSLVVTNDPADGTDDSIAAGATLPPGALGAPLDRYVTSLNLQDDIPDHAVLDSLAFPDDLRAYPSWGVLVDIHDPDSGASTSLFAGVVLTSRTVPEPQVLGLLVAAAAALAYTGRMPRFFAGSGSSGRAR